MKSNFQKSGGIAAGTVAALLLAAPQMAAAQSAAQAPMTAQEAQQLQSDLQQIRADSEAAKQQEARREQQIDEIERRLQQATGVAPAGGAPPCVEIAPTAGLNPEGAPAPHRNDRFQIYGFAQTDYIQDFNRVDPNWADTLRPSKIPTTPGQFGQDGQSLISVKQSRLGFQGSTNVAGQPLSFKFEFDVFGVGADAGQTTIRFRHIYGQWGPVLVGQTNSLFMDGDIFPNVVDYWGPVGMVFLRNPQVRWTILNGPKNQFAVAVEKPGNDVDVGQLREVDPSLNVSARSPLPDFTAQYRYNGAWGHLQVAGILRELGFESIGKPDSAPNGEVFAWGINTTTVINTWKQDKLLAGVVYGEGIASYMNDGGTDLAPEGVLGHLKAEAEPLLGISIYYDHYWNKHFSTSLGWSENQVWNQSFQQSNAFNQGQYASVNLLWTPAPRLLFGGELLWGRREDKDGDSGNDMRLQFTAKYSFTSKDWFQ